MAAEMLTCKNMTCPEACCSAQPLRDHGIDHNDDHCCSRKRYRNHKEMMDTLVAPFKHLNNPKHPLEHFMPEDHHAQTQGTNFMSCATSPTPIRRTTSTALTHPHDNHPGHYGARFHENSQPKPIMDDPILPYESKFSNNNYSAKARWNHFPFMASCVVAFSVVVLAMIVAYYAIKWRSKYLKSKRASAVAASYDAHDAGTAVGASTYFIPSEESLPRSLSSTRYTEMVNTNGKRTLRDAQATSITIPQANQLPTYEDLFANGNDDGVIRNQQTDA